MVGRPRDEHDRIKWLLQHQKFEKSLSVARVLRQRDRETWDKVALQHKSRLCSTVMTQTVWIIEYDPCYLTGCRCIYGTLIQDQEI